MIAQPAKPGLWLDMSQKPTPMQMRAIIAELNPEGVIRAMPLPNNNPVNDIDASELSMWMTLGVQVMGYQHVRASVPGMPPGWDPRNHSGAIDGAYAAAYAAASVGFPPSVHNWVDWEDLIIGLSASASKVYLEGWANRQLVAGYLAGMYCGFDDPMSPIDRYNLHGITSYWSDMGHRIVAGRGCSIVQGREITVAGMRVDFDHLAPDLKGETPMACTADFIA